MADKFLTDVGLARRAGKLTRGRDETFDALKAGKAGDVFLACDVSERTGKQTQRECERTGARLLRIPYTMEQLGTAAGCKPLGVFAVADKGLRGLLEAALAENKEADE